LETAASRGAGNAENVALPDGRSFFGGDCEESHDHDASQEAEGMVMEAIIRRYYYFPIHSFGSSSISFSNFPVFLVLLVMEFGRSC
jgi:hypothetical protein